MTSPTVSNSSTRFFWLIVLSVFCSPLTVLIEFGFGQLFFINVLLWLFIPMGGFIQSTYLLSKRRYTPEHPDYEPVGTTDAENRGPAAGAAPSYENDFNGGAVITEYHDEPVSAPSKSEHINSEHEEHQEQQEQQEPEQQEPEQSRPVATEVPHSQSAIGSVPMNSPPPYGQSSENPVFDNKIQRN